MNRTISHLHADMDRARQQGARSITINLLDLKEILALADSAHQRETADAAKKHAGWARPGSIMALRTGQKKLVRISKRKSEEFCVELFFGGALRDYLPEAEQAQAKEGQP